MIKERIKDKSTSADARDGIIPKTLFVFLINSGTLGEFPNAALIIVFKIKLIISSLTTAAIKKPKALLKPEGIAINFIIKDAITP